MKNPIKRKNKFLSNLFFSLKIVELIILELTSGLSESTLGCHEKRENLYKIVFHHEVVVNSYNQVYL